MPVLDTGRWGQVLLPEPGRYGEEMKTLRLANRKAQKELDYFDKGMELEERKVAAKESENTLKMMEHWRKARADADDRTKQDMDVAETMSAVGLIARDRVMAETGDKNLAQAAADEAIQPFLQFISDPRKYGPAITTFGPEDEHLGKGSLAYSRLLDADAESVNFYNPRAESPEDRIKSFAKSDIGGIANARSQGMFEFSGTSGLQLTGGDVNKIAARQTREVAAEAGVTIDTAKEVLKGIWTSPAGTTGLPGEIFLAFEGAAFAIKDTFDALTKSGIEAGVVSADGPGGYWIGEVGSGTKVDASYLMDEDLYTSQLENLAGAAAANKSALITLAFMIAKAREPAGRGLSDSDVARALESITGRGTLKLATPAALTGAIVKQMKIISRSVPRRALEMGISDFDYGRWQEEVKFWEQDLGTIKSKILGTAQESAEEESDEDFLKRMQSS